MITSLFESLESIEPQLSPPDCKAGEQTFGAQPPFSGSGMKRSCKMEAQAQAAFLLHTLRGDWSMEHGFWASNAFKFRFFGGTVGMQSRGVQAPHLCLRRCRRRCRHAELTQLLGIIGCASLVSSFLGCQRRYTGTTFKQRRSKKKQNKTGLLVR